MLFRSTSTCAELGTTNHLSGVPGCTSFGTPRVLLGGACAYDWECVGGWCAHAPMTLGDGTCQPFAAEGAECTVDHCATGATCVGEPKACVTLRAEGAACASGAMCASGVCDARSGTCAAPAGGACFYATGCRVAGGAPVPGGAAFALGAIVLAAATRKRRARPSSR